MEFHEKSLSNSSIVSPCNFVQYISVELDNFEMQFLYQLAGYKSKIVLKSFSTIEKICSK